MIRFMLTRFEAATARIILTFVLTVAISACVPVTARPTATDTPAVTLTGTPAMLPTSAPPTVSPSLPWPTATPFANEVTFEIIGQIGGSASAIAVKDKVAYLGVGPQVLILDVSNPAAPRQIGQSRAFPGFVGDIAITGDLVYIAAGKAGLRIMDLTEPLQPRQVSVVPSEGSFEKVVIRDDVVFIAEVLGEYYFNRQDMVRLFDVSDPANPRELNRLNGYLLDVQGNMVYVIQDEVLKVADISHPQTPLDVIDTGLKNASAVSGQYVYTVDVTNRVLGIVDLSDPGDPQPRGSLEIGTDYLGQLEGVIKISADLIYVKNTFWGESGLTSSAFFLVDVSDPDTPEQIGSWSGQDEPSEHGVIFGALAGEALEDNLLYLALESCYSSNGLWIVDVSDPTDLHHVGSFYALTGALNAISVDKFAYVLRFGFSNDLEIVDLTDLNNIQVRMGITSVSALDEMPLVDHYLYLPASQGTILDLASSIRPLQLNRNATGLENSSHIKIAGEHACASNFNGGLNFIDVSDPANPRLISHLDTEDIGYLACADTEALYIVPSYGSTADVTSLHIVDISDITRPVDVFSQRLSIDYINDVAYGNGYLYVTVPQGYFPAYHEQLWVFDVSDQAHPRQVSTVEIGPHNSKISIMGHYVYLAGDDIMVFDVSDPAHPRPVGKMEIPGGAFRITVLKQDTLLVTSSYLGGIFILRIDGLK